MVGPEQSFQRDLSEISQLQQIFNRSLRIADPGIKLNYNPVLARWKYEKTANKDRERLKGYELFQVQKALRERDHTAQSVINYALGKDGNLYNELYPDEPFDTVLLRGLIYRKNNGSDELEREQSEYRGWQTISAILTDKKTPLHTKAMVISGPGIIWNTNYKDNFVDIYEASEDSATNKRSIKMTRYASRFTYDQYENVIKTFRPDYFDGKNGPIDALFLGNPIFIPFHDQRTADDIFDQVFAKREDAMKEEDFQKIYQACLPVINYYIDALCKTPVDPEAIALAWNAVLNKNDLIKDSLQQNANDLYHSKTHLSLQPTPIFADIQQEVYALGRQPVKQVMAGCGSSSGFSLNGNEIDSLIKNPFESFLSNGVGKFGINPTTSDNEQSKNFICPSCHKESKPPVGDSCPKCGITKEKAMELGLKTC